MLELAEEIEAATSPADEKRTPELLEWLTQDNFLFRVTARLGRSNPGGRWPAQWSGFAGNSTGTGPVRHGAR